MNPMETWKKESVRPEQRPSCFGDEVKFMAHMDDEGDESDCRRCPSENDCGEFILMKCSRELIF
jgi:hypothetical protein